nr:histone H3.v1-like isoform X1 [Malus domestica]
MDHQSSEDQKLQAFDKFIDNKYYAKLFITRTLKFVVSVSLLSLFLFVTSSGFCVLPDPFNQFNAYFSTLLLSIFTHTLERKYIFLICNGILAFLAKTSTNSCCCSCNDESDEDGIAYVADEGEEEPTLTSEEEEEPTLTSEEVGQLQDLEKQQNGSLYTENHEEMQPEAFVEEEEEEEVSESLMKQGEEETETQELATNSDVGDDQYDLTSSTDELNKKIEEFIRKMKEEIRIEAQRQPIIAA